MYTLKAAVGNKVRTIRKASGLTQEQMAEKAGITEGYLGTIERGEKWARPEVLEQLAKALKVAPGDLFPPGKSGRRPSLIDEAYAVLLQLPEAKLKLALGILKVLQES